MNKQELLLQLFYASLNFWKTRGSWYQKKTFIHSHLSWSSITTYLLPPSFMIHGILPVQFMCLAVFFPQSLSKFSLVYLLVWHPPLHTPYISSPNHCLLFAAHAHRNLFCCSTEIMSCNPSLSQPFTWNSILSLNATYPSNNSYLCLLKCHLIFLSYRPGLTSMKHTTLHTTAVQSPSLCQ